MSAMVIINGELLQQSKAGKFLLNESGVVFFPSSQQHSEVKIAGLSYEDDYRGNAVAGTFQDGRADIRFHEQFSDERIRSIWDQLCTRPELAFLQEWKVHYQGREI